MRSRGALALGVVLGLVLLLGGCRNDPAGTATRAPAAGTPASLVAEARVNSPAAEAPGDPIGVVEPAAEAKPCADPGACVPRNVHALDPFRTIPLFTPVPAGVSMSSPEKASVEDVLEQGLRLTESSPVHLAFRGTAASASVRCEWRGIARTAAQREATIRSWLGLDESLPLPAPASIERLFLAILNAADLVDPESARASFRALARGGVNHDFQFLACYVDYTVSEYVLGAGPTTLTVVYDRIAESTSYDLYWRAHAAGEYGTEALLTEAQHEAGREALVWAAEEGLAALLGDREALLFVAPLGAHNAIAVEAWQVVDQWDLQTVDGTVNAVRYGALEGDPEHTQTLAALKTRITRAAAADAFANDRITNASGLSGAYRTMGAYGDIDPSDGATTTFTPAPPPAALTCASGTAVTDPDEHRALVRDCEVLLDGKAALAGTATLNWSATTAIAGWTGVTTSGTPERVTGLALSSKSLSGNIPAGLGGLSALTTLNLSSNSLTGAIPAELGLLRNLTEVRLSGNSLTGCIPAALKSVATNDLSSLSLLYCSPPAPATPAAGTTAEDSVALSWTAVSSTSKYRVEYRHDLNDRWTEDSASVTGASHTVDGLRCEQTYAFRVSAYGSGTTYTAAWSAPSLPLRHTTSTCMPPVFGAESYSFTVAENAATGAAVGTVVATDPGGVTYGISEGNAEGTFTIDESTGAITVAGELDHETVPSLSLTVAAWDAAGGVSSVPATVTVTDVNEAPVAEDDVATTSTGTAVAIDVLANDRDEDAGATLSVTAVTQPANGAATINADGTVSYTSEVAFVGADAFTYTVSDGAHSADGSVTVTVTSFCLNGIVVPDPAANPGLVADCEILRAARDTLRGTATLDWSADTAIADWTGITVDGTPQRVTRVRPTRQRLNGTIPAQLGGLSKLEDLQLSDNALTGPIPAELGMLSELDILYLFDNELSGAIPASLGNLAKLRFLGLRDNQLTGPIPATFATLWELQDLLLNNNRLTGAIPAVLGDLGLRSLYVAGNSELTGCIPAALSSVTNSDLATLGLDDCAAEPTHTLTTSSSGSGSISPRPGTHSYRSGALVRVVASAGSLLRVASWGGDCAAIPVTEPACVLTIDSDKTVSVTFERITYTLTAMATGGGSVTPDGATTHAEDREVTLTASWDAATHSFIGWGDDCAASGTEPTCTLTMDANKTVTATFARTTYTLTTSAGANGSILPAPDTHTYARGTSVTVTATPDEGYRVAAWGNDCGDSGRAPSCVLTMDADWTASVTFEPVERTLTVTATEGGSVEPGGTTAHDNGAEVTLTASWNDATHSFTGWSGDCADSGTASTCVLTMNADKTVTATFTALPADRCATPSDADCIRAVYVGAPGDYAQVTNIPAGVLLAPGGDGRYPVERGQRITVVTAAPLPEGYTRFYLQRRPSEGPAPTTHEQLIAPLGTTYTFTVTADAAAASLITFDLTAARPWPLPRPGQKPELGDVTVTATFATGEVAAEPNSLATGAPAITGTLQVGETLTADTAGIADADGLTNVSYSYQWLADDANIQGATDPTYTLGEDDEGETIKVRVSFTDDANNEESLTSAATDAVAALPVPGRPLDLDGEATAQGMELTWSAPPGDTVVEYVIYRAELQNGQLHGRPMTKYATIDATGAGMAYTDADVEAGVEYRYRVAAVNSAGEGKKSTWLDIAAQDSSSSPRWIGGTPLRGAAQRRRRGPRPTQEPAHMEVGAGSASHPTLPTRGSGQATEVGLLAPGGVQMPDGLGAPAEGSTDPLCGRHTSTAR